MFSASNFDLWSDGMLAYTYIAGAQYEYHFEDLNDPELKKMNCTIIDAMQLNTTNSTNYRGYMYNCFKQDFNFGIGTLMIMFGPGFLLSVLWAWGLRKSGIASCIFIIASPVISGLYPILLFCVKVSLLLNVASGLNDKSHLCSTLVSYLLTQLMVSRKTNSKISNQLECILFSCLFFFL